MAATLEDGYLTSDIDNVSTDECSLQYSVNPTMANCDHVVTSPTVSLTVDDTYNPTHSCEVTITVTDGAMPVADCQATSIDL